MQKIRQLPLLFILVAASMLCAGLLQIAHGHNLFTGQGPESTSPLEDTGSAAHSDTTVDESSLDHFSADTSENTETSADSLAGEYSDAADPSASGSEAPSETYEFTEVAADYLDDALFIGDSRVEGVKLYSGWDNLTYYAEGGLTVYNIFQREIVQEGNQTITIEEALQNHSSGKIYLEIGINEMGTGTVDSFMKQYQSVVDHLRELQPDAILFLCGIMVVTEARSETDSIFNNPNINERNERIAALADQKDIFYLDFNEVVMDENGNLNIDYTWDAVHLLGKYDSLWLDYFCSHGIVK